MLVKPEIPPKQKKVSWDIPEALHDRLQYYIEELKKEYGGATITMSEVAAQLMDIAMTRDRAFRQKERAREEEVKRALKEEKELAALMKEEEAATTENKNY